MNVDKVRASYDTVARKYAETWPGLEAESPLEIALLLDAVFRRLRHGHALQAHLVVGDQGLLCLQSALQIEHGPGIRGVVEGRLQLL